jgi:hypothetical protein
MFCLFGYLFVCAIQYVWGAGHRASFSYIGLCLEYQFFYTFFHGPGLVELTTGTRRKIMNILVVVDGKRETKDELIGLPSALHSSSQ